MNHLIANSIIIYGKASQKVIKRISIPIEISDDLSLMDFLRSEGITIASSCAGEGTCQKCLINSTLLSCQISVKKFIEKYPLLRVEISYL